LVLLPQFFGQLPKGLASTLLTLKHWHNLPSGSQRKQKKIGLEVTIASSPRTA
jgi:hypothetical protein